MKVASNETYPQPPPQPQLELQLQFPPQDIFRIPASCNLKNFYAKRKRRSLRCWVQRNCRGEGIFAPPIYSAWEAIKQLHGVWSLYMPWRYWLATSHLVEIVQENPSTPTMPAFYLKKKMMPAFNLYVVFLKKNKGYVATEKSGINQKSNCLPSQFDFANISLTFLCIRCLHT